MGIQLNLQQRNASWLCLLYNAWSQQVSSTSLPEQETVTHTHTLHPCSPEHDATAAQNNSFA
jgi:hypothetical protein